MLVGDLMRTRVVTVTATATVADALRLAQQRGIRHLPVVEAGRPVGIVSDRDFKRALAGPDAGRLVGDIMSRPVITTGEFGPVEEAARVMLDEKISALPVVRGETLVGILTETDIVRLFVRALGASEPSSRIDVVLPDQPAFGEIVRAMEEAQAPIASIVTLARPDGTRMAVVRIATINPGPALRALERRGFAVRDGVRAAAGA